MLRRYPFTFAMLLALALAAVGTGSHDPPLTGEWLDRLGFAPRDLPSLQWVKLITSVFVTHGGGTFWRAMVMVALFVGGAERAVHTRFAASAFWGVHVVVLIAIGWILRPPGMDPPSFAAALLPLPRDVGPSVGAFACLGLALATLPATGARRFAVVGAVVAMVAALFLPPLADVSREVDLLADVGHLAGFLVGGVLGCLHRSRATVTFRAPPGRPR
jgi:hypothetical protein